MDPGRFRKRVLTDLVSAPSTLLPAAAGLSLLMFSWAVDQSAGWLALAGLGGLLAGIGSLATRWIFRSDAITRQAFAALQAEDRRAQQQALDALDRRLQEDDDPQPERHLRMLRKMYDEFQADSSWTGNAGARSALEITAKVEKLFKACIISLERSAELWETSRKMATKQARTAVLEKRRHLLEEVEKSVGQLAGTLDGVRSLALDNQDEARLAQVRRELNESLDVARRVEQRMHSLDAELDPQSTEAERE